MADEEKPDVTPPVEDDNKEERAPAPAPPTDSPEPKTGTDDELKNTVKALADTVAGLVTTVTALADNSPRDVVPKKRPWTHPRW